MHVCVYGVFWSRAVSYNDVVRQSAESDEADLASAMDLNTDLILSDSQGESEWTTEGGRTFEEERWGERDQI